MALFRLEKHEGKYVVIKGGGVLGYYRRFEEALGNMGLQESSVTALVRPVSRDYLNYGRYGNPIVNFTPTQIHNDGIHLLF